MQPLWQYYPFSKQLFFSPPTSRTPGGPLQVPANSQQRINSRYAEILIETNAIKTTANSHIYARFVPDYTPPGTASQRSSPSLIKPPSWTPLRPFILECELRNHPDRVFVRQLINNLQQGCTIGYIGPQFSYLAPNLQSASQQPDVIDATLSAKCEAGKILGPFDEPPLPNFRTSGLGLVPKHDGGWQIIYHLSVPFAQSINDFIDPQSYTLSYCTIDDACKILYKLGPGALINKIDLKNAFHLIQVRPADWNLLGVCWCNWFFVDTCLPFGLRSAHICLTSFQLPSIGSCSILMVFSIYCTIWMTFSLLDQQIHNNVRRTYNLCFPYAATSTLPLNY